METIRIDILDSKAKKLLKDLADMNLINIQKNTTAAFSALLKKERHVSIEQYNAELELALKEVKQGKSISHDEVVNKSKKWLKRK